MRCPEHQLKNAILHPEAEVRETAVRYWNDAPTDDTSIMPKVIEAVEQYGRHESFSLLRKPVTQGTDSRMPLSHSITQKLFADQSEHVRIRRILLAI